MLIQVVEEVGHRFETIVGNLIHFKQFVVDEKDESEKRQDHVTVAKAKGHLLTIHHLKERDLALWRVRNASVLIRLTRVNLQLIGLEGRERSLRLLLEWQTVLESYITFHFLVKRSRICGSSLVYSHGGA